MFSLFSTLINPYSLSCLCYQNFTTENANKQMFCFYAESLKNYDREDYDEYGGRSGNSSSHRRRSRSRSRSPQMSRSHRSSRAYHHQQHQPQQSNNNNNYRDSESDFYNQGSSSARESQTPNSTLMIRNLPQDITEKDVQFVPNNVPRISFFFNCFETETHTHFF